MSLEWINIYVDGLIDHCYSRDIYEIYDTLKIKINKVDPDNFILQGNKSMYIRDYFGIEVVFINDALPYRFEKFVLAHELGHALLHTELGRAAYSNRLAVRGKLEKQADYFAIKLLNVEIDEVYYECFSSGQIASDLCIAEDSLIYI